MEVILKPLKLVTAMIPYSDLQATATQNYKVGIRNSATKFPKVEVATVILELPKLIPREFSGNLISA